MSYTREQRAANAAKQAQAASDAGRTLQAQRQPQSDSSLEPSGDGSNEPRQELEFSEAPKPRNDPRNKAMDELLASREPQEPTAEPRPKAEDEQAPEPVPLTPEQILAANTPADPAATVTAPTQAVEPVIEMVKVKVDGVESEVPKAEVEEAGGVRAYQTAKAADNRLNKANEALAQTRQVQAQIATWAQQQQAAQPPKLPELTNDQFIQSKVDLIRFGTPEESAAALRDVIARGNPRIDQNQITQTVMSQISKNSAVDSFKKEFQDIVSNPILLRAAISLENERAPQAQANPQTDWGNFFRTIGNEVRSATGRQTQPATTAVTTATPSADPTSLVIDKEARKSSIVNLPTAAARAALPTESKPETREDTLNAMRKSRGIQTG